MIWYQEIYLEFRNKLHIWIMSMICFQIKLDIFMFKPVLSWKTGKNSVLNDCV